MDSEKIMLTPQEIFEKEFKIDTRGYRPQEVDKFLDIIIKDYTEFISLIKKLKQENDDLMEETLRLKHELRNLHTNLEVFKGNEKVTNVDIIRRLSHLEKIVYGKED
ncbi:MAG: cell division regulator GpsB [Bacilli bacterium]|jgi:DivIVA domain-containing protein